MTDGRDDDRLGAMTRERDEARAKVARVEALVEANSRAETVYVARVRAALAGPDEPTPTIERTTP